MERFWSKVEITDGCWLWTGAVDKDGYGRFAIERVNCLAHRVAYELVIGPIPDGLQIDHVKARGCVHRHCVRPDHLEAVTQAENIARGKKGSGLCAQGHPTTPRSDGRGGQCLTCKAAYMREYRSKTRSASCV